jgi:hypothetical protein
MMIDRSSDACVGDGISIEVIPVAVPHHKTLHRISVIGQPVLEFFDGAGSGVVSGSSCRRRGDNPDQ